MQRGNCAGSVERGGGDTDCADRDAVPGNAFHGAIHSKQERLPNFNRSGILGSGY